MPNRCNNVLTVGDKTGLMVSDEKIRKALFGVRKEKKEYTLSFQNIKRIPKELDGCESPPTVIPEGQTHEGYAREKRPDLFKGIEVGTPQSIAIVGSRVGKLMTYTESERLKKKYGHNNRYDRQVKNRGCKRDVNDCVHDHEYLLGIDQLFFDTPRAPPEERFALLCKKLPDIEMTLEYEEPGCDMAGVFTSDGEGGYSFDSRKCSHDEDEEEESCDGCGSDIQQTEFHLTTTGEHTRLCCDCCNNKYSTCTKCNNVTKYQVCDQKTFICSVCIKAGK